MFVLLVVFECGQVPVSQKTTNKTKPQTRPTTNEEKVSDPEDQLKNEEMEEIENDKAVEKAPKYHFDAYGLFYYI